MKPTAPRSRRHCPLHGMTEFSLLLKAQGNGGAAWRCMQCTRDKANRYYARKAAKRRAEALEELPPGVTGGTGPASLYEPPGVCQ